MKRTATLAASGGVAVAMVVGTLAIAANIGVLSSAEAGVGALEDGAAQQITVTLEPTAEEVAPATSQPETVAPAPLAVVPSASASPEGSGGYVDDEDDSPDTFDDSDGRDDHSESSEDDDDDDRSGHGGSDDDDYEGADDDD